MKKAFILALLLVATIVFLIACSKSGDDGPAPGSINCNGVSKTWSVDVSPIIQTFCNQAGCHNAGSVHGPGPLLTYTQVFNARSAIRDAVQSGRMPQNTTLSSTQKSAIICWIDNGAPNN